MSNRNKLTNSSPVHQNRSAAGSAGSKAQIGFASVNPVQKKDAPAQLKDEEEPTASLKADPAQLNQLEEEVK